MSDAFVLCIHESHPSFDDKKKEEVNFQFFIIVLMLNGNSDEKSREKRYRSEWKIIIIINNTEALSSIKMIKNKQMSSRESIKVSPHCYHSLIDANYSILLTCARRKKSQKVFGKLKITVN